MNLPYEWWPFDFDGGFEQYEAYLGAWWASQQHASDIGAEIVPPWIAFPGSTGTGFKQGIEQSWFIRIWMPYWCSLPSEERNAYVERWNAPPEWHRKLLTGPLYTSDSETVAEMIRNMDTPVPPCEPTIGERLVLWYRRIFGRR